MTSPARLMAAGMPQGQAVQLGQENNAGLKATGSTKATALVLAAQNNFFATVSSGTGCLLPPAEAQSQFAIYNGGSNALLVYAQAGETINALTTGASFSVTNGKSAIFVPAKNPSATPPVGAWIANLSA